MRPRESPQRKIETDYPPNSVILAYDHVNGVRSLKANKVIDQWQDMMIEPLVGISTSEHT